LEDRLKPNQIAKVLSTLSCHGVKHLLMGGQACVFYGAATFSKDCDIVILADQENLQNLTKAIDELKAELIAVPPFDVEFLRRGHSIHFRCRADGIEGIRLDVMSSMRGVEEFAALWARRTTLVDDQGDELQILSVPDLVKAKKTQRDKDWPMIRLLIERHFRENSVNPAAGHIEFWLRESRTASMLVYLAKRYPKQTEIVRAHRPLLVHAESASELDLERELDLEMAKERELDRGYWNPLKKELEELRVQRLDQLRQPPSEQ
jgi:hypothetical protein